jgi:hypothetical protein
MQRRILFYKRQCPKLIPTKRKLKATVELALLQCEIAVKRLKTKTRANPAKMA